MNKEDQVLRLANINTVILSELLRRFNLKLILLPLDSAIPGSYWGEPEAGLIGTNVYARSDTPVHSVLHEACHLIVMSPEKRIMVHTDATDSVQEEDAACRFQQVRCGSGCEQDA